ncbi:MAG: nucleotidyltransferase domain-containing protein [Candidatus Thermoplasmatota archaeon]|jgi:tRNA CCA-adding enzyme|nr:nucleotidyltransferase domain-containing protein [Candidatus Thermoplasmatota archaeon]
MDEAPDVRPVLPPAVRDTILSSVAPTAGERERVQAITDGLLAATRQAIVTLGASEIEPIIAGSVAKGTFSKDPDLDIFLLFPESTSDSTLEGLGLAIGEMVLQSPVKKYTQHPYLTGTFNGAPCDMVPCLKVSRGEKVRTAVDRTPHHVEYVNATLRPEQRMEVLLLKSFLKGIGAYGAEDTVNGLSGYLTELLIITFGGLSGAIRMLAAIKTLREPPLSSEDVSDTMWLPEGPVVIDVGARTRTHDQDPLRHMADRFPREPLIIIDPVDPRRNVASPVSAQTLAFTARCARALLEEPSKDLFHPFSVRPLNLPAPVFVSNGPLTMRSPLVCPLPEGNSSIVATQLRRILRYCLSSLRREGFASSAIDFCLVFPNGREMDQAYARTRWALRSATTKGPILAIGINTDPSQLPPSKQHWGPPSDNPRSDEFRIRWGDRVRLDAESGRLFTVVQRGRTMPKELLIDAWSEHARGLFAGSTLIEPLEEELRSFLASVLSSSTAKCGPANGA